MASRQLALAVLALVCVAALWRLAASHGEDSRAPLAAALATGSPLAESKAMTTGESTQDRSPTSESARIDELIPSGTLRARCVDEHGAPIAGVELLGDDDRPLATSAADGRVEARLPAWRSEPTEMSITLVHRLHRRHRASCRVSPGEVCELGDVVLLGGGRILGRVVGPEGQGVPNILVGSTHLESARWSAHLDPDSSTATSADDGSFVLEGVPAGAARVVAFARGCPAAGSEPLQVVPGAELAGVEVRLGGPVPAESRVTVKVLDPEGKPLPAGVVIARRRAGDWIPAQIGKYVEPGTVSFDCRPEELLGLRASDCIPGFDRAHAKFAAAYEFDVGPAQESVEMRLQACTMRALLVLDERGDAVEQFAFRTLDENQYRCADSGAIARDAHGLACDTFGLNFVRSEFEPAGSFTPMPEDHVAEHAKFCTPQDPFLVQVEAQGYAPAEVGPFPGERAPAEIRVVLHSVPGLRGWVESAGVGVPGAAVRLMTERVADPHDGYLATPGVPRSVELLVVEETKTTAEGSFVLRARDPGRYLIRAGIDRASEVQVGPLELSPRRRAPELLIELPRPGAIEGRILAAAGHSHAGRFVGATRCFGPELLSTGIDEQGRFRFDGVPPGRWTLREYSVDPNAPSNGCGILLPETCPRPDAPRTCEVRGGETAHVELDLRAKVEIVAHIELAEWKDALWTFSLTPLDATFALPVGLPFQAKSDALRLSVEQPGDYQLLLEGQVFGQFCGIRVMERVQLLAGNNTWALDGPTGKLTVVNASEKTYLQGDAHCETAGSRRIDMHFSVMPRRESELSGLPVGRWRLATPKTYSPIPPPAVEVTSAAPARMEWK